MEHYRKLERMYAAAPINQRDSPVLTVADGRAEVRQVVGEHLHHSARAMHGSVYFKMLDDACFFAANSRVTETFVLTARFEIDLLRPVSSGEICARAQVIKEGSRRIEAAGELFDAEGQLVARGAGVFVISKMAFSPEFLYA